MRHQRISSLACLFILFLCGSCANSRIGTQTEPEPLTAILGAFDKEVMLLEDRLTDTQEHVIEEIRFVSGLLEGRPVVIVWTGIGKVNAAMSTTLLLEHFKPDAVIFTGIAGGVNKDLKPGDIVIADRVAHHDMGTLWPDALYYRGVKNRLTGWENPVFFEADRGLLSLAQQAGEKTEFLPVSLLEGPRQPKVITGVIVTGDVFVASPAKCDELRERLEADAVEMEGAAVAQLCYQRQIPCLVIRSISDNADEGAVQDKQMFYILAAENSSHLVGSMMELMKTAPASYKTRQFTEGQ